MVTRPLVRTSDLLTEELDGELLVYDEQRDVACRLNRTAALVWRSSDGQRTLADLVEVLREEVGELADEDLVMVTLDHLEEHGLIESGYTRRDPNAARLSRRRFIRRVGVVGTAALALPVVQSIVAPTPAAAQSGGGGDYYYYYNNLSDDRLKRNVKTLRASDRP
jgi:hypothetical protein